MGIADNRTEGPWSRHSDQSIMPAEWEPHERCVMAFCAAEGLYSPDEIGLVRHEQALVADTIAAFEPVTMLVNEVDFDEARRLCGPNVELVRMAHYDVWTRDTLPTVCFDQNDRRIAVSWNFNVWGEKFEGYDDDRGLAARFADHQSLDLINASIVTEGGALETDGRGTLITTESSLLNPNRNPGMSARDIEAELLRLTGARKIIWLPGTDCGITDGHIDEIARFVREGVVVVEVSDDRNDPGARILNENARHLEGQTDAAGRPLEVIRIKRPRWDIIGERGEDYSPSYVNCYIANGAVILPRYGDPVRDDDAREIFAQLMPDRRVVQVMIDEICEGGGGLHCTTQQVPRAR